MRARARARPRRIVFPESGDPRTLAAVRVLAAEGIVAPVLVLDPARPETHAAARAVGVPIVHPATDPRREAAVALLLARRAEKGLDEAGARRALDTPLYDSDALVALGEADGCVAGAAHTTADVLRAALWLVGAAPGVRTLSSAFYMVLGAGGG